MVTQLTQVVAGRTFDYSHCVGRGAVSGLGFSNATGVAFGEGDVVYVLSRGSEGSYGARVSKLTVGKVPGDEEFITEFGNYGEGEGQFTWPTGIATDRAENVYVSDEWLNRVSIFDQEGKFLGRWGTSGSGEGQLNGAAGIAFDPEENLYVVDSLNHRVQKFTREGKFLTGWGRPGSGNGEFDTPWGIAVDRQGCVYVADHKNHRVQRFSPDGEWTAQFGSYGTGRGQMVRPVGVAVDPDGDVYVCDWGDNGTYPGRVHIYAPEAAYLTSLIGNAMELSRWARMTVDANLDVIKARRRVRSFEPEWRFALPRALAFDAAKGRLMVVDTQRSRLQIYNKVKNYMEPQFNL